MELLKKSNGSLSRTPKEVEKMIDKAAKAYGDFLNAVPFTYSNPATYPLKLFAWVLPAKTVNADV